MIKKIFALILCILFINSAYAEPVWSYPIYIKALISDVNRLVNKESPP